MAAETPGGLARFAAVADLVKAGQTPTKTITSESLGVGVALCFDQSLAATGWSLVCSEGDGWADVVTAGNIPRPGGQGGWEETLACALRVSLEIRSVVRNVAAGAALSLRVHRPELDEAALGLVVVHEAPPSGAGKSGRLMRPESSALAALGVRIAAHELRLPVVMLHAQSAKYLLCGTRSATKAQVREALMDLPFLRNKQRLTNEGRRDSAALGMLYLAKHAPRG